MKKRIVFYLFSFLFLSLVISSCNKDDDDNGNNNDDPSNLTEREKAIKNYKDDYLGSECADPGWTGSTTGCVAGDVSQAAQNATVKRVNYFRELVGLPGDVVHNPNQNSMCQEAALIFKANNNLSHNPPQSWQCWTQDGYDAAGGSNIGWGSYDGPTAVHASNAVTGYIEDYGAGNEPVGHRAWILYPQLTAIGHGSTSSTNCLMWKDNLGTTLPADMPDFVAYPPDGFIPAPLVFERWSFSIPNANFSNATVTMKDELGADVTLNIIHVASSGGAPDARVVWKPNNINTSGNNDVLYTVTIDGITNAAEASYTYTVKILPETVLSKSKSYYESPQPEAAERKVK